MASGPPSPAPSAARAQTLPQDTTPQDTLTQDTPAAPPSPIGYRRARCICLVAIVVAVITTSFGDRDRSDARRLPAVYRLFGLEPKPLPPGTRLCHRDH